MTLVKLYASRYFHFNGILTVFLFCLLFSARIASSNPSVAPIKILAFGDSLIAGMGLNSRNSFPEQLAYALKKDGYEVVVINAGVSGDTTAGGVARVDWVMRVKPDLVILELGANDGLRGFKPAVTKKNLEIIIRRIHAKGAQVLLAGMRAPPNMGKDYGETFNEIFSNLADIYQLDFYPFFLDGVASIPALNQIDGIHPNNLGVRVIVDKILPTVKHSLEKLR